MAGGLNKVMLIGYLGQDPEIKDLSSGKTLCNMSIATTESWKDKSSGEKVEKTEWHRIVVFGPLAVVCGKYLVKGSHVYIEGKLQTRKWEDKQGNDRYTTEVVAFSMQMLGGKGQNAAQPSQQSPNRPQEAPTAEKPAQKPDFDDEIPF